MSKWTGKKGEIVFWCYATQGHALKVHGMLWPIAANMTLTSFLRTLCRRSSNKARTHEIRVRITRDTLPDCVVIFASCLHCAPRYFMDGFLYCAISHKMEETCDKRLARFISYMHHFENSRQYRPVRNQASECKCVFPDAAIAQNLACCTPSPVFMLRIGICNVFRYHE